MITQLPLAGLYAHRANPVGYWFVAFPAQTFGPPPPWYMRCINPRWRHCLALTWQDNDKTLIAEHIGSRTRIETQPRAIGDALRELQERNSALVLLVEQRSPQPRAMMRGPMTCVEFVKGIIGIRSPWIVTPHQLYRHLRRAGASHVFPTVNS
jgi:hypothetical protein